MTQKVFEELLFEETPLYFSSPYFVPSLSDERWEPYFTLCLIPYCCNIVYRQPPTIDYSCTLSRVERVKEYQWSTNDNSLTFNINVVVSVCRHLFHNSSTLVHPLIVCLLTVPCLFQHPNPIPDNNKILCEPLHTNPVAPNHFMANNNTRSLYVGLYLLSHPRVVSFV